MSTQTHLAIGPLLPFHRAGILGLPDVQVATALMRIGGHPLATATAADADVGLGVALCVRALRTGSVCIDLADGAGPWGPEANEPDSANPDTAAEPAPGPEPPVPDWPNPEAWLAAARAHPLVAQGIDDAGDRPLRLVGTLLYLQRYWCDEQQVRTQMRARAELIEVDLSTLGDGLARLFPAEEPDRQRLAAASAALRRATIIAGGPGTGKTTTVARIVALLRQVHGPQLTVALAAPTGKAAARLAEAISGAAAGMEPSDRARVGELTASTLHRLLGWQPGSTGRFRRHRSNPLPHDVVIVDEASMVSLPLMARLMEATRPDARLILVGDPDQLASIDAGAVLGDLVHAPGSDTGSASALKTALAIACPRETPDGATGTAAARGVVTLDRNYRFGRGIGDLAAAIRDGNPDDVLDVLTAGHPDVAFLDVSKSPSERSRAERTIRADVFAQAEGLVAAARGGDAHAALATLEAHRVLCAHREGSHGVRHWNELIAAWTEPLVDRATPRDPWYLGRPLLVTANDYTLDLYNGDTGVIVADPADGAIRAAFARPPDVIMLPPARLGAVETLHAMTIHRAQGSQYDAVTVVLPPAGSPLLTRELLYTGVTRAKDSIRIVGTPDAVRAAVQRTVRRASGLRTY